MGRLLIPILSIQILLIGCVSIPKPYMSEPIEKQELKDHVYFLADSALKGRKPGSAGSKIAKQYIIERFRSYGLVPWGETEDYELPFILGKNIIGVLPGYDKELSDRYIFVCAHYDHLGDGYLGAADNASGVAALLEIAERLSSNRPRRSVCFASFDCEEIALFGSFAFTCREDFDTSKIDAVINIDILGRSFLDVMDNAVFLSGTMQYPEIRREIQKSAESNDIQILPIGTDVLGPRGDHVAFEEFGMLCLFFTAGIYGDYHSKTDIAEKINYDELERSANTIYETVKYLANADEVEKSSITQEGDHEELLTIKSVVSEMLNSENIIDSTQEQLLIPISSQADNLISKDNYSLNDREIFIRKGIDAIYPYLFLTLLGESSEKIDDKEKLISSIGMIDEILRNHRTASVKIYRKFIKYVLDKSKLGVAIHGIPEIDYTIYDSPNDGIAFIKEDNNQYRFSVLIAGINARMKIKNILGRLSGSNGGFGFSIGKPVFDCMGSVEEITDYCILCWNRDTGNESYCEIWQNALKTVTGEDFGPDYDEWFHWRLIQAGKENEKNWLLGLMTSLNPSLAKESLFFLKKNKTIEYKEYEVMLSGLISNSDVRSDVRALGIQIYGDKRSGESLLNLVDILDDNTLSDRREYCLYLDESYPFYNHYWNESLKEFLNEYYSEDSNTTKTLGDLALEKLKELTNKDFGKDKSDWQNWISKQYKIDANLWE